MLRLPRRRSSPGRAVRRSFTRRARHATATPNTTAEPDKRLLVSLREGGLHLDVP